MIIKKEGKINEIIYEHTTYHSGKYTLFPTITDLNAIIEKLIQSKSTTEYLRITPFYINEKVNMQIEFDEYMFYLECREQIDETALNDHVLDCLDSHYPSVSTELFEMGKLLYPLCQHNDIESYKFSLEKYREYLGKLLPILFDFARRKMKLKDDDLAFGYFCFEVHSG